ncbi:hypothetical protein [Lentzea flaviverrucosa]|uniref:Uncharacterized protein n=1 Tax=Lentzea flaviverrucosa TaxID=200379 RepID=A0A1H9XYA7_9PSEU|nr:hypothetical protein [Lentzea flaviverrucosa]RDI16393.1 hypothetical protein DFR72_12522 [Lentzea flaviverrucosa]SES51200.1 hypothetical protein SAMN05216195_12716 [Lentzea flaviverrucosa]
MADSFAPLFTWTTGVGEFGMVMLSGQRAGKPYTEAYVSRCAGGNRRAFALVDLAPGSPHESFDYWRYRATGWRPNGDTPAQQKYPVAGADICTSPATARCGRCCPSTWTAARCACRAAMTAGARRW